MPKKYLLSERINVQPNATISLWVMECSNISEITGDESILVGSSTVDLECSGWNYDFTYLTSFCLSCSICKMSTAIVSLSQNCISTSMVSRLYNQHSLNVTSQWQSVSGIELDFSSSNFHFRHISNRFSESISAQEKHCFRWVEELFTEMDWNKSSLIIREWNHWLNRYPSTYKCLWWPWNIWISIHLILFLLSLTCLSSSEMVVKEQPSCRRPGVEPWLR